MTPGTSLTFENQLAAVDFFQMDCAACVIDGGGCGKSSNVGFQRARVVFDLGGLRRVHGCAQRLEDLTSQIRLTSIPSPGASLSDSQKRENPFRRTERCVSLVVVEMSIGVTVGVATVTAKPTIGRNAGVIKQLLAPLDVSHEWLRTESDLIDRFLFGEVNDRKRIVQGIGHDRRAFIVSDR